MSISRNDHVAASVAFSRVVENYNLKRFKYSLDNLSLMLMPHKISTSSGVASPKILGRGKCLSFDE